MKNANLKSSWKNYWISAVISIGLSAIVRLVAWYVAIYNGPVDIISDDYCFDMRWMILILVVLLPACWALCYNAYTRKAAERSADLHGVKIGSYGRPWIGYLIALIVALFVFSGICMLILKTSHDLDYSLVETDVPVLRRTLAVFGIASVIDCVLFICCSMLFKPSTVQNA